MNKTLPPIIALLCLAAVQCWAANIITTTITAPPISLSPLVNGAATVGQTQGYLINFTDAAGWHDIGAVQVNFCGEVGSNVNACIVYVDVASQAIWVLNDSGNWDQHSYLGTLNAHLSNSQIDVNVQASGMVTGGNTVTLAVSVAYKTSVAWHSVWGIASDQYWQYSQGWTAYGWMNITLPTTTSRIVVTVREGVGAPDPGEPVGPRIDISQANSAPGTDALSIYHINDPIQFTIRNAQPNSQVWAKRNSFTHDNTGKFIILAQTTCTVNNGHDNQGLNNAFDGACLLGSTDSTGYLEWNGGFYAGVYDLNYLGLVTIQFYVGTQTIDPTSPGTTVGPMNEDNYIGGLTYFVQGSDGLPAPPWN